MMPDLDTLLSQAKLPERTVQVCLRGDLLARWQQLEADLAAASASADASSLAGDGSAAIVAQMEELRQEMVDGSATFTLRALSDKAFGRLRDQHQPRPDNRRDMLIGYNPEALGPALIRACIADPALSDEQWEKLQDVITPGEWRKLDQAATALNFDEVNVPFLPAVSKSPPSSG